MKTAAHRSGESGVVLLTTLLILMIVAALMAGFFASVNSDVRATAIDRDQTQAYAVAHAGLEKLTSSLAQLFAADFSPSRGQILALNAYPPSITGFEFKEPGGTAGSGYKVGFSKVDGSGNPIPEDASGSNITSGPYKGMKGIITNIRSRLPRARLPAIRKCGCAVSCRRLPFRCFSSACFRKPT